MTTQRSWPMTAKVIRETEQGRGVIVSLSRLWPLLGRWIAFHKRLVDLTGSVKASLMLSQAIYWTRRGRDIRQEDGWFFKTIDQWQYEIGLSRHEQASSRAILRGLHVLAERKHGVPAKSFFRVDGERLARLLSGLDGRQFKSVDWDDTAQISELLGPVRAFHRCLLTVTGNVNAGLFLSRAVYFTRLTSRARADGRFSRSVAQWQEDTGLTWREQAGARKVLRDLGVVEEMLKGVPPQVILRIDADRLIDLLLQATHQSEVSAANFNKSGKQGCGIPTSSYCAHRRTRMWQPHMLISRFPADNVAGNCDDSLPVSEKSYVQNLITRSVSTKPLLLTPPDESDIGAPDDVRGGEELIFPTALLREEKVAAEVLVKRCPRLAQAMLDELAARMDIKAIRVSPIGYLRGMVKRAQAGDFVPELGLRIAESRVRRERAASLHENEEAERQRLNAERANPAYQARISMHREEIHKILKLRSKRKTQGETQ